MGGLNSRNVFLACRWAFPCVSIGSTEVAGGDIFEGPMVILALHSFAAARYDLVQTPL
jgi:hypothetical protein